MPEPHSDCTPRPWVEVSFVALRSGLNSAIKNFGDIKQITTPLHLGGLSVKIHVSDFGEVESAYHRLTSMVLFPESPHLLEFEIPLRAFLTIRRDRLKMYPPGSMGSSLKHIHTKV